MTFYGLLSITSIILLIYSIYTIVLTQGYESNKDIQRHQSQVKDIHLADNDKGGGLSVDLKNNKTIHARNIYDSDNQKMSDTNELNDKDKVIYYTYKGDKIIKLQQNT